MKTTQNDGRNIIKKLKEIKNYVQNLEVNDWNTYQKILNYRYENFKELFELGEKIISQQKLLSLASADVISVLLGIAHNLIEKSSRTFIEWDKGSLKGDTEQIEFQGKLSDIDRGAYEIFIQLVNKLNEKFKCHSNSVELFLPFKTVIHCVNFIIANRIEILSSTDEVIIKMTYSGSYTKFEFQLRSDLSIILALLEFEEAIIDSWAFERDFSMGKILFPTKSDMKSISIDWKACEKNDPASIFWLKQAVENECRNYYVRPTCHVHFGLFKLLDSNFKRHSLLTAIPFFHSNRERLPSFEFLKYWFAIEVMSQARRGHNEGDIIQFLCLIFPNEEKKDFEDLYQLRCDLVHKGTKYLDKMHITEIKKIAKDVFYKLFQMEHVLEPI